MKILTQRIFALLLPLALLLSVSAQAMVGAEFDDAPDTMHIMDLGAESTALLPRTQVYEAQFPDVSPDSWYYAYAAAGYEYGLFGGRDTGFAPDADITVAELLTLSARIRAAYDGDTIEPATGERPWYMPYATYLHEKDLLDISILDTGYDTPATRAQLAGIFALSLPENCFDGINAPPPATTSPTWTSTPPISRRSCGSINRACSPVWTTRAAIGRTKPPRARRPPPSSPAWWTRRCALRSHGP